jgi:hypothetical protein
LKRPIIIIVGKDMEKLEAPEIIGGNIKRYVLKIKGKICPLKNLYINVHLTFRITEKWKQSKCVSQLINRMWPIHMNNGILLRHVKEWNTDICYNGG